MALPRLAAIETVEDARQARAVGRSGFAAVYDRFVKVVHGIVLGRVGPQDAEDVTQEVFMAIHAGLDEVRDQAALPGWICSIARNAATDHLRRRQRRPEHAPFVEVQAPHADDDSELAHRVLALIGGLPEAYRETLVLRLVEGLSGPEIAERTGLTHGSLRVNLCRGMALLRPLLEKEGWR